MLILAENIDRLEMFLKAMWLRGTLTDDAERLRIWNSVKQARCLVLYGCEVESMSNPRIRLLKTIAQHPAVIGSDLVQPSTEERKSLRDLSRKLRACFRRQQLKVRMKAV